MKPQDLSEALGQIDDSYIDEAIESIEGNATQGNPVEECPSGKIALDSRTLTSSAPSRKRKRLWQNRLLPIAACLVLVLIAVPVALKMGAFGPAGQDMVSWIAGENQPEPGLASVEGDILTNTSALRNGFNSVDAASKASYDELYDLLTGSGAAINHEKDVQAKKTMDMSSATGEIASDPAPMTSLDDSVTQGRAFSSSREEDSVDHSETNIQVEGIDEGDIVETDGRYIYRLAGEEVVILSAAGKKSAEVARISLAKSKNSSAQKYIFIPNEIYLSGDRLIVVRQAEYWSGGSILAGDLARTDIGHAESSTEKDIDSDSSVDPSASKDSNGASSERCLSNIRTFVDVFDVKDPAKPTAMFQVGQDGVFNSSRLIDDTLVLITNSYVNDFEKAQKDKPETYVPRTYASDGTATVIDSDNVCVMPSSSPRSFSSYATVGCLNLTDQKFSSCVSLLGEVGTCYMAPDALYAVQTEWITQESDPYKESVYKVVDCESGCTTSITRLPYADGIIKLGPTAKIAGSVLNQYSLDEYKGSLRVAICDSRQIWKELSDASHDVESIQDSKTSMTNSLYVFDENMLTQGSIKDLASDEEIKSVRFSGDIGYVVTFREIDPLFAIDLSDPAAPTVLSALKIPGFSSYLHPFGEGRLLGFGESVEGNAATNLKLSMFDTTDPTDVTEIASFDIDGYWSEGLNDPKAVFIDVEKGIIGVPVDGGYQLYTYTDKKGFASFKLSDKGKAITAKNLGEYSEARGLFCGDALYVCSDYKLVSYGLENGALLKTVRFNKIEDFSVIYDGDD